MAVPTISRFYGIVIRMYWIRTCSVATSGRPPALNYRAASPNRPEFESCTWLQGTLQ